MASEQQLSITQLLTEANTNGAFTITLWVLPAFHADSNVYCHHDRIEGWYVLAGKIAITLDDRTELFDKGAAFVVQRGLSHVFWNPTPAPTSMLIISAHADLL